MDSSLLKHVNNIIDRKKTRFDRRLAQFSIFFAISAVLWFLLKLSHEYTTDIKYPVQLINIPTGKMLIGNQSRSVLVKVKAHGYTLLRYKVRALMVPIKLPITDYYRVSNSTSEYYMLTRGTRQTFSSQIDTDLDVIGISTDSLFFQMTEVIEKNVPIIPSVSVSYAKQHMLSGDISISPKVTKIIGPKAILDTIYQVKTEPLNASLISSSQSYSIKVVGIPQTIVAIKTVNVTIPVQKFTEITLNVPITPLNVPYGSSLVILPSTVSVTCNVIVDKFFLLKPSLFIITCDYNDRNKVANGKIRLNLIESPSYVSRVKYYPEFIDYFIRKK